MLILNWKQRSDFNQFKASHIFKNEIVTSFLSAMDIIIHSMLHNCISPYASL